MGQWAYVGKSAQFPHCRTCLVGKRSAQRACERRREGYPPAGARPRSGLDRVARSRSDAPNLPFECRTDHWACEGKRNPPPSRRVGVVSVLVGRRDDGLRGRGVAQQDDVVGRFVDRLVERGSGVVLLLVGRQHVHGKGEVGLHGVEDGGVDGDDFVSRRDVGVVLPEGDAGVAVDDDGLAIRMNADAALCLFPGRALVLDAGRRIEGVYPVFVDRADDVSGAIGVLLGLSSCPERACLCPVAGKSVARACCGQRPEAISAAGQAAARASTSP